MAFFAGLPFLYSRICSVLFGRSGAFLDCFPARFFTVPLNRFCDHLGDTKRQAVSAFTYPDSSTAQNSTIDNEVNIRIAKAYAAFGRLKDRREIRQHTKLKVYEAIVLLYACETWTVHQRHAKRLNRFHLTCLRKILNICWQDHIPDTVNCAYHAHEGSVSFGRTRSPHA